MPTDEIRAEIKRLCWSPDHPNGWAPLSILDVERLIDEAVAAEKARRIYYQDIVYAVCNEIDKCLGGTVVCGTVDEPSRGVQEALPRLVAAERERCAKKADDMCCSHVAAAIRQGVSDG